MSTSKTRKKETKLESITKNRRKDEKNRYKRTSLKTQRSKNREVMTTTRTEGKTDEPREPHSRPRTERS